MSLDFKPENFQQYTNKLAKQITALYQELEEKKVFNGKSPREVQAAIEEPLPEEGMGIGELLEELTDEIAQCATLNVGPYFYGYITGGGNQAAILAEMFKAALNQNNLKWHSSPISTEMEKLVVRWVAQYIGYPDDCAGVILEGGSVANFESLAVARKIKAPVDISEEGAYGSPRMTLYVSEQGHSSFDKAVDVLGIGKKYLRKIPVDDQFRVRSDLMERKIEEDLEKGFHPICGIAIAGTTNTGAVDDLQAVAEVCRKYDLWYHIDAAYGGPAAGLENVGSMFAGLEQADSVVVNPHKWMYVPFGAACALVKTPEHLRKTFSTIPDYLKSDQADEDRTDLMEYNLPLTKEFRALKVWMTIKAYGAVRLREAVQADIDKAFYLVELIRESDAFELMAPAPLSIVCFRYIREGLSDAELDRLNDRIVQQIEKDGRIFLTGTKIRGRTALRACFINHRSRKEHVQRLLEVIREIGDGIS